MNTTTPDAEADTRLAQVYLDAYVDGELAADERALALARLEADAAFKATPVKCACSRTRSAMPIWRHLPFRSGIRGVWPAVGRCRWRHQLILALGIGAGWLGHDATTGSLLSTASPVCRKAIGPLR